jgi:hypothetical protein
LRERERISHIHNPDRLAVFVNHAHFTNARLAWPPQDHIIDAKISVDG